uniref:Cellulose synthase n=1 Tax=Rhizophora mucronata TaxID=61149 RepID=A0A2P2IQU7_RHIMU
MSPIVVSPTLSPQI